MSSGISCGSEGIGSCGWEVDVVGMGWCSMAGDAEAMERCVRGGKRRFEDATKTARAGVEPC